MGLAAAMIAPDHPKTLSLSLSAPDIPFSDDRLLDRPMEVSGFSLLGSRIATATFPRSIHIQLRDNKWPTLQTKFSFRSPKEAQDLSIS